MRTSRNALRSILHSNPPLVTLRYEHAPGVLLRSRLLGSEIQIIYGVRFVRADNMKRVENATAAVQKNVSGNVWTRITVQVFVYTVNINYNDIMCIRQLDWAGPRPVACVVCYVITNNN